MFILHRPGLAGAAVTLATIAVSTLTTTAVAETVATVNGVDIDSVAADMYISSRIQKPADEATAAERETVMEELTDIYLLTTQASAEELGNDPKVKAQIELQSRAAIAQAVATDFFEKNPATDEEILVEYELQMKSAPPLQFKARHILVETQAAAVDVIAELDSGANFAELAATHSTGPTGPNGGDLGWFAPAQMVRPFSDAVAQLSDGAHTSEPVQSEFGWHVILREDSRENQPPTLESVRDVIKQRVEQSKFQNYLARLRAIYTATD